LPVVEKTAENPVARGTVLVQSETGRGKDRLDFFADERCSQTILDFLATTDVGRRIPDPAKEDAQSEVSELREREDEAEERSHEVKELGAGGFRQERNEVRRERGIYVVSVGQARAEGRESHNEPPAG
jgi:hypothetical protein